MARRAVRPWSGTSSRRWRVPLAAVGGVQPHARRRRRRWDTGGETSRRALRVRPAGPGFPSSSRRCGNRIFTPPPGGLLLRAGRRGRPIQRAAPAGLGRPSRRRHLLRRARSRKGAASRLAHDQHRPRFEPDLGDRPPTAADWPTCAPNGERFPVMADRPWWRRALPVLEQLNGDLLIDRHPAVANVSSSARIGPWVQHGPAVGRYAADLPHLSLATPRRVSLASSRRAARAGGMTAG